MTSILTWPENVLCKSCRSLTGLSNAVCRLSLRCLVFYICRGAESPPPRPESNLSEPARNRLNPRRHRGMGDATPLPKVFRGYRQHALADLAEIWHIFAYILFTPILKISRSGQVRSRRYDVIHDVMFCQNRRILLFIASGWVLLPSGVGFCIAGSINGV